MIAQQRRTGALDGLRPREQQVLELMARGLSNAAICAELHLSIKTVEPIVSGIFDKLELHADATSNRRVLAVLAYLRVSDIQPASDRHARRAQSEPPATDAQTTPSSSPATAADARHSRDGP